MKAKISKMVLIRAVYPNSRLLSGLFAAERDSPAQATNRASLRGGRLK